MGKVCYRGIKTGNRWFENRWFKNRWFKNRWFENRWFENRWFGLLPDKPLVGEMIELQIQNILLYDKLLDK